MDLAQIKAFIDAMASSDLAELEASKDGWTLRLVRHEGRSQPASRVADRSPSRPNTPTETLPAAPEICAPLSGIVYLRAGPDLPPYVEVGQAITAGMAVCVIEAMKTFIEVRAERDGVVEAILVSPGTLVEAGQPLMRTV
ncbi:acetyl-CoA carboxylase biotin carboxyl carrier protein [Bradyrhizobium iriomotense]|uniref:Biotin carboxyl carrier protein of acetyl-CoA carboxylase n=1 Tax=Bradyrhizobium iriomotense TaxID=441950 RepID=A0ABQ6ATW2_9BRAD|nr:acetyl-CoA carboxylase biotin carboxyl carrier protein subunit [Bradyrhizobium iriomotense]GLR83526.1 acetyl-CoA carboxylase biotin carboxyl carrier protein subunit [Bradyrhizobium iriomotense]